MSDFDFSDDVKNCLSVLNAGGTILYPTDTIWGVGCDAENKYAIDSVFKIKERPSDKAFIILLDEVDKLSKYISKIPPIALEMIDKFDTPLTIIYHDVYNLPKKLLASDKSVAIRVIKTPFLKSLIAAFGKPIVSSSANKSGKPNPLIFSEIDESIINQVDYVVNFNRNVIQQVKPSTIIDVVGDWEYDIIRS